MVPPAMFVLLDFGPFLKNAGVVPPPAGLRYPASDPTAHGLPHEPHDLREMIVRSLSGLTHDEAENILALSLLIRRCLDSVKAGAPLARGPSLSARAWKER
jgi:hypothetical protein